MLVKVLLLICPIALDHAACDEKTALDVVPAPNAVNVQQCAFAGQVGLAPTAIAPDPKTQYLKVVCRREPTDPRAARR